MFEFTIKPKDLSNPLYSNVQAVNRVVNKISDLLLSWEPVSIFPKSREIDMSYDTAGPGSITFTLNFLTFTGQGDLGGRAVINMLRREGLYSLYYVSNTHNSVENNLVYINDSREKGYAYPAQYFPELASQATENRRQLAPTHH